jgi:hypothetical protein
MSAPNQKRTAWAHSDRCTAPGRTREQSTLGRDEVSR